jgi:hypothetical protein
MSCTVPGTTVDGVATTWFAAPSLVEGAALARRIVDMSAQTWPPQQRRWPTTRAPTRSGDAGVDDAPSG